LLWGKGSKIEAYESGAVGSKMFWEIGSKEITLNTERKKEKKVITSQ